MMTIIRGDFVYKVRNMGKRTATFTLTNSETGKSISWRGADTAANNAAKRNSDLDKLIEEYKKYLTQ
jgi:hypothetical protein